MGLTLAHTLACQISLIIIITRRLFHLVSCVFTSNRIDHGLQSSDCNRELRARIRNPATVATCNHPEATTADCLFALFHTCTLKNDCSSYKKGTTSATSRSFASVPKFEDAPTFSFEQIKTSENRVPRQFLMNLIISRVGYCERCSRFHFNLKMLHCLHLNQNVLKSEFHNNK